MKRVIHARLLVPRRVAMGGSGLNVTIEWEKHRHEPCQERSVPVWTLEVRALHLRVHND